MPPVITFDVGAEDLSLPVSKGSWFASDQAKQIAVLFLEQYLAVYDSDDRQPLLDAYHDSAVFSITASAAGRSVIWCQLYFIPPSPIIFVCYRCCLFFLHNINRLEYYLKDSRNLKRVEDAQRRMRLLHQGKVDIVAFLTRLPKTTHDPASLIVDVPIASVLYRNLAMRVWSLFIWRTIDHSGSFDGGFGDGTFPRTQRTRLSSSLVSKSLHHRSATERSFLYSQRAITFVSSYDWSSQSRL